VLTVPFQAHTNTVRHIKPALKPGAIVVDASVPLATAVGGKVTQTIEVWDGSAAQQAQAILPKGISVAAAFQNVSADLLNDTRDLECDVIICTDDPNAREVVTDLVHKIPGLRALDGGALENAHIVEKITALLITLNIRHKSHSAGLRITGLEEPSRRQ
jgi:NADPH-dependent F420 reductase